MIVQPYLSFEGRCEEAIQFYRQALGAEVLQMMRFNDSPEPCPEGMLPPNTEQKIMHASLKIGESIVMATDGQCTGKAGFAGISLSLSLKSDEEASQMFNALSDGGKIEMPMNRTFFASSFGMVSDRFGVSWMIVVPVPM